MWLEQFHCDHRLAIVNSDSKQMYDAYEMIALLFIDNSGKNSLWKKSTERCDNYSHIIHNAVNLLVISRFRNVHYTDQLIHLDLNGKEF